MCGVDSGLPPLNNKIEKTLERDAANVYFRTSNENVCGQQRIAAKENDSGIARMRRKTEWQRNL
jgi:hypothetical protein